MDFVEFIHGDISDLLIFYLRKIFLIMDSSETLRLVIIEREESKMIFKNTNKKFEEG